MTQEQSVQRVLVPEVKNREPPEDRWLRMERFSADFKEYHMQVDSAEE
jgi:hypothetical protein